VAISGNTIVDCLAVAGDAMCATNRVFNQSAVAPTAPTFRVLGTMVTATGNRVTARGPVPSIRVFAVSTSAVGNASSNGATVAGALKPAPYATFNVT